MTLYSTADAAEMLGTSARNIDELDRRGIAQPTRQAAGCGSQRGWSFADIVAIRIGLEWRAAGVEWDAIRKMVRYVQRTRLKDIAERPYLALCGTRVWACEEGAQFTISPSAQMFVCDLRPGAALVRQRIERHEAKTGGRTGELANA